MNPRQTIYKKIRINFGLSFIWLFILSYVFLFANNCPAIEIKVGDNELTITWIKPTKNEDGSPLTDLAGYYIYRSEGASDKFKRLNVEQPVRGICYTDPNVINGITYFYEVTAVDYYGNESERSPEISGTPNILPPSRFKVKPGDGEVQLFWDPYEKSELMGYNVYRRSSIAIVNTFEKITTIPIKDTYYIDLNVANGIAYFYKVSCVGNDGFEGIPSQEEGATPLAVIPEEPSSVRAQFIQEANGVKKVLLTWEEVKEDNIIGYRIYRRLLNETEFTPLTTNDPIRETQYIDTSFQPDKGYLYSIVAVTEKGMESQYPKEIQCFTSALYIASFTQDAGGKAKRAGDKICFCLRGEPGLSAFYKIEGLTSALPLEETGEGIYTACLDIVEEMSIEEGAVIGLLEDSKGNKTSKQAGERITIDNQPPDIVKDASAKLDAGIIKISWEPPEGEFAGFEVCRQEGSTKTHELGSSEMLPIEIVSADKTFCYDARIKPGRSYSYSIFTLDRAGNKSDPVRLLSDYIPDQEGIPLIKNIRENTAGLPQKTGDRIEVELTGEEGCKASFFIPGIIEIPIPMNEKAFGQYLGYYIVGPNDKSEQTFIKVCLKDDLGHENCQIDANANDLVINCAVEDVNPPVIYSISHNAFNEAGFSGKLVPGNKLEVTLEGEARCKAYFIISSSNASPDIDSNEFNKHELIENPDYPGSYSGAYTIGWKDQSMDEAYIWACMSDRAGNKVWKQSKEPLALDIRPRIEVKVVSHNDAGDDDFDNSGKYIILSAGEDSKAEITANVTNANKDPVEGHSIAFTITTTDEYTGVVGGGDLGNQTSTDIGLDFDHTTDSWGEVETLYTSGEAAKTAIIVAKDLTTGHAGVSYILNVLKAQIAIDLKQPASLGKILGLSPYKLILTANPDRLTADGVSSSWITAQITDRDGRPVEKAGIKISFFHSGGGTISPGQVYTDNFGQASTRYTAGIIRGTDIITGDCVDLDAESGKVTIALMSDAPAKMVLSADPNSLFANGIYTSNIKVRVLDKNENSVQEAMVNFSVNARWKDMQVKQEMQEKGTLSAISIPTDFNGWAECTYTTPDLTGQGSAVATITTTTISKVPTEEEIARAVGTIFVPILYPEMEEDEEVKILEWLIRKGDEINEGDPVVRIETQNGEFFIKAPVSGEMVKISIHRGERVKLGQTIGQILADEEYWEEDFYD